MVEVTYTVEVTRESDAWIADVTNLAGAHTYAKGLTALHAVVDEVIRLVADLDDDYQISVTYSYENVDDDFLEAASIAKPSKTSSNDSSSRRSTRPRSSATPAGLCETSAEC